MVKELIDAYINARQHYEYHLATATTAKAAMKERERELVEAMLHNEQGSIRQSDVLFTVSPRMFISCTLGNKDEVAEWLVGKGYERQDVVREELSAKRVREIVTKVYKEEGKEAVPECLKLNDSPGITATGWKSKFGRTDIPSMEEVES